MAPSQLLRNSRQLFLFSDRSGKLHNTLWSRTPVMYIDYWVVIENAPFQLGKGAFLFAISSYHSF